MSKKNYLTFIFIFLFLISNTQEKDVKTFDTKVLYELTFKKNTTSKNISSLEAVLFTDAKNNSFFTFKNMVSINSIQNNRKIQIADVKKHSTAINFVITKNKSLFIHYEKVGLDIISFNEDLVHDWTLEKESREINGYNCRKATVSFGGRDWIAWYTLDIPIDAGPYKFYGLPGLILQVNDSENIFKFEAIEVSRNDFYVSMFLPNYFITENKEIETVEKSYFIKLRNKFYSLDVNGRLNYIQKNKEDLQTFVITDVNGNNIRRNRNSKKRNFIEK